MSQKIPDRNSLVSNEKVAILIITSRCGNRFHRSLAITKASLRAASEGKHYVQPKVTVLRTLGRFGWNRIAGFDSVSVSGGRRCNKEV